MTRLTRALLTGLIDYAGLFPPAGLGMAETVANYAAYQRRNDHWALARLVVPINRLGEFDEAIGRLPESERRTARWPISGLAGADPAADRALIQSFNQKHKGGPRIEALEARVVSTPQIEAVKDAFGLGLELYCELPLSADLPALAATVKRLGLRAKIRTGGVKPVDFPAPEAVLAFVATCAAERLSFKATAGLHHPVRGPAPLTYAADAPCATMYGYLNLVLAASLLWNARPEPEALALLTAENRAELKVSEQAVDWNGIRITTEEIETTRRDFMLAIGSCSFTEPLGEIRPLGFEPDPAQTLANAGHRTVS